MDFEKFKKTIPEQLISRIRLEKLESFIDNSLQISIPVKEYLKSPYAKDPSMNWYGPQDIYDLQTSRAIHLIKQMIVEEYSFYEVIVYIAFERWKTALLQNGPDQDRFNMGQLRMNVKCVRTKMIRHRGLNTQDMFSDICDGLWPDIYKVNIIKLNSDPTKKYYCVKINYEGEVVGVFILPINILKMEDQEFFECQENFENDLISYGIYEDSEVFLSDYIRLERLFTNCVNSKEDFMKHIAILHWWMCIKTPILRGGGTAAEWLSAAFLELKGFDFKGWNQDVMMEPWTVAVTHILENFIREFPHLVTF